jgi:hypothetical protein
MPVYEYQGAHYELADGLSNEQAIQKIKGHLGQGKPSQQDQLSSQLGKMGDGISAGVGELGGALKDIAGMFLKPGTKPDTLSGEMLQAGAENTGLMATGAGAQVAGLVPAGLQSAANMSKGQAPNFEQNYAGAMDALTFSPRSELGQEGGKAIGEFMNRNVVPVAPMIMGSAGAIQRAANANIGMKAFKENTKAKKARGPDTKNILAELEQKASSSSADRPQQLDIDLARMEESAKPLYADQRGVVTPELPDAALQAAKAQLEPPKPGPQYDMIALEKQMTQLKAQQALEQRQQMMEQQVKQQTTLEMQAAERARQEQASTGFQEHVAGVTGDRAIGATAEGLLDPATGAQRAIRAEEPMVRQGQETLYTDPAAQTFRGDPRDPMAMLGLERQKEAARNALQHGIATKRGQPLDLLTKEQLRASNEGPQVGMQELMQSQLKQELQSRAVAEHPFVRKAEERLTKQEELITKLSEQVQKGKATASKLAREVKNLENFEAALSRTRENVEKGIGEGQKPVPFGFKQRGVVNPEVFKEGFEKVVNGVGKIEYHIRSRPDERGILPMVVVEAKMGKEKVGEFSFYSKENDLVAAGAETSKEFRNMGIARGAYEAVAGLGNDIVPSGLQTKAGKAMWEGFKRGGLAEPHGRGYIPKSQKGAVLIDPGQAPQGKFLSENPALKLPTIVPMKLTTDKVVEMARAPGAKDVDQNFVQKALNYATKGGIYQALKTDNVVVKFAQERVHDRERAARGEIQKNIHDKLAPASRDLPIKDAAEIWAVIDSADKLKTPLTEEMLVANGFNEKQIHYWKTHRDVMDVSLNNLNNARKVLGKEPVSKRAAYAAMSATGDYRKLVYKLDEAGEKVVVGVIGSDWRALTNHRAKALEEAGYVIGEEKYYGGVPKQRGSAQQAFQEALEVMSERDPRVAEFLEVLKDVGQQEAYSFLNVKKHTLNKKGIFGMEGRKTAESTVLPWTKLAEMNAKEGMQSQLNYAEAAIKFGHIAEAARDIQTVINDKNINMPNAKRWAEEYLQNAMGFNPSKMGSYIEAGIAEGVGFTGMGYSNVRGAGVAARKTANTVLLALNPAFWTVNGIQLFATVPGLKASLIAKGLDTNFDFGTGYSYVYQGSKTALKAAENLSEFERGLHKYAKDSHVYGSDLIEHSNRARKDAIYYTDKVGNAVAGTIESVSRRVVFYTWAHMLHENGLSVKNGLYEAAHNLTDMAMNNYSMTERPKMYNSMGPIGELATNLSSYKHNEFSRIAHFARQVKDDKSMRPLLVQLTAGILFAGVSGTVAFAEADWLYRQVTKALGKPDSLTLRVMELSEGAGKKVGMTGNGKYALSHGAFSLAGLDMSKRLGLGNAIGDTALDIAFPGGSKLVDIGDAAVTAATSPTEMNAKRLAREVAPGGATGHMDLEWFSKDTPKGSLGLNKRTMEAQVMRTPGDKMAKRFGFTGINESVEKEKLYQTTAIKDAYADMRKKPLATAKDELFSKGQISDATIQKYLAAEGDIKTLMADISRMNKNQNIPAKDRELLHASMSKSITSLRHAQRLQKVYEK